MAIMESIMDKKLDCRGLQCPQPVIRCRQMLETGKPDEIVVIVDNTAAVENVGRFLNRNGYETSSKSVGENVWEVGGKKTANATDSAQIAAPSGKTLVLITTNTLGRGDDELGAKLMNTFLETLPELGDSLWRIVLLNGGVKLASTSGPALESLKKLSASGIDILVCGTCLMHFGLLEKKEVGGTTNMMDVMTSLALADKVIRP